MSKVKSKRLPKVGEFIRMVGTLIAIEEIPPEPVSPQVDYIFEEINARCELRFGGEVVQVISCLTDFCGRETSVETAIKDMERYAESRGLDADSELEAVVVRVATQCRKRPRGDENFYDPTFSGFGTPVGATLQVPRPVEEVVWSSKQGDR